jgi:hypothetical protein
MTDDLVKRLRMDIEPSEGDMEAAADRIQQLEAALLEIFDHECRTSDRSFIACTARDALWPRAALGEKKE